MLKSIELKSLAQNTAAPSFSNIPSNAACAEECKRPSNKRKRRKTETEDDERNQNIELKCIRREIKRVVIIQLHNRLK